MSNNKLELPKKIGTILKITVSLRKPYSKPKLDLLGDLRNLTLGGSIGVLDSSACYPTTCPSTKSPPPHHGPLIKPQGLSLPGGGPSGATPTPDNPFLP
jgi:hypothetical protein